MQPFNRLRIMTVAFLFNGDDILLLERSANKTIYPNFWSGVGGHVESDELQDIRSSCLREIHEETNIPPEQITSLTQAYLLLRHTGDELWQTYVYIGTTSQRDIHQTDEGTLRWIPVSEMFDRDFIPVNIAALRHYLTHRSDTIHIGIAHPADPNLISTWHPLLAATTNL